MEIKVCNIKDSSVFAEKICAGKIMRFLYGTRTGGASLRLLVARRIFSRLIGVWADSRLSARAALKFASDNKIDMSDVPEKPSPFGCFNDFFTRKFREGARPVAEPGNPKVVSFPCDGRHLLLRNAGKDAVFNAKGRLFNLSAFLGGEKLARRFAGGDVLVSRLSPVDYHRYHYPVGGVIAARRRVDGPLYSVSPVALVKRPWILWENKRVLNFIESETFGMCLFAQIGATNVGSIVNFGNPGDSVPRGGEAGMFKFGGSCIVTAFPPSAHITWNKTLVEMGLRGIECFAELNSPAGVLS